MYMMWYVTPDGNVWNAASLDGLAWMVRDTIALAPGPQGSLDLSDDFTQLRYGITYQGLSIVNDNRHLEIDGRATADTRACRLAYGAKKIYVNFHTLANPGGEVRGSDAVGCKGQLKRYFLF